MMAAFSPLSRRIIAAGLLVLALLLALELVVLPLAALIGEQRDTLYALRQRGARLSAAQDWPRLPRVAPENARAVLDARGDVAAAALAAHLSELAAATGVTTGSMTEVPARNAPLGSLDAALEVSGPQDAVLELIARIERGRPVVRIVTLTLVRQPGLDGTLSAQLMVRALGQTPS